jgi:hypothetical protein
MSRNDLAKHVAILSITYSVHECLPDGQIDPSSKITELGFAEVRGDSLALCVANTKEAIQKITKEAIGGDSNEGVGTGAGLIQALRRESAQPKPPELLRMRGGIAGVGRSQGEA